MQSTFLTAYTAYSLITVSKTPGIKLEIMTVLLTGGTGKTSVRIARFLQDAKVPFVLASRKAEAGGAPSGMPAVKFDWQDSSTFENPFQHKSLDGKKSISAVYLVAPEVADPTSCMTAFVDLAAKKHGVKRFVLLAGSTAVKGGWHVGKVWQHLDDVGVEYCVLMPTWFMGAFFASYLFTFQPMVRLTEESRQLFGPAVSWPDQRREQDLYGVWGWQDRFCQRHGYRSGRISHPHG